MSTFRLKKKFSSYDVNLETLRSLENYLLSEVPEILNIKTKRVKRKENKSEKKYSISYKISIVDSLGTETINSIDEFTSHVFSDITEEIKLSFNICKIHPFVDILDVSMKFSTEKFYSNIDIICGASHSREKAISIYEGIKRVLDPYKTKNYIFHFISPFFILLAMSTILALMSIFLSSNGKNKNFIFF